MIATTPGARIVTPATRAAEWNRPLLDARRIVTIAVAITITVTLVSLVAAIAGRMLEQRRQLTLLRTIGVPASTLLATISIEIALPLVVATTAGTTAGALTAAALVAGLGGAYDAPVTTVAVIAASMVLVGVALTLIVFPIVLRATVPRNLRTG